MKNLTRAAFFLVVLMFISAFLQGCVHLPNSKPELPYLPPGQTVPGLVGKAQSALGLNATHSAIQTIINWQVGLCIAGGLGCLVFGGLAIYGGQLVPGIKLVAAGVLLPIFAIWWSYHWLFVVCLILIGGALYWLLLHWAFLKPAMAKVETWAKTVESRIPTQPPPIVHS